jgi:hypothetical protein
VSKKLATRKPTQMSASTREKMEAQLAKIANRVDIGGGRMIRLSNNRFVFPDETKVNGPLEVIVIDSLCWNTYYDEPFDKDNPIPPVCYAFGEEPKSLVPSENSKELQIEPGESCQSCHWNEFKSAPNGKSKACQNRRLLCVLPPDASEEDEEMLISVSPSAIQKYDAFVLRCRDEYGVTPVGVICQIDFNEAVEFTSLTFDIAGENPDIDYYFNKIGTARALLTNEPSYEDNAEEAPKRKALPKKKVAKKKVAKKKASARR